MYIHILVHTHIHMYTYIYIYMELCTIIHLEVGFLIAKYFILEMCVFICISNCSLYVIFSVDTTVTYYTMWLLSDRKIGLHVFISQLNLIKRKIMHKLNFRHHSRTHRGWSIKSLYANRFNDVIATTMNIDSINNYCVTNEDRIH